MSNPFLNVKLALISGLCLAGGLGAVQAELPSAENPAPTTSSTTIRRSDVDRSAEPGGFAWGTRRPEPRRRGSPSR
jgi:hypothetical protein